MDPRNPITNVSDGVAMHSVDHGNLPHGYSVFQQPSDDGNVYLLQLGAMVSSPTLCAPLTGGILKVILGSSREHMAGIAASWIVTPMTPIHAFRKWAMDNFPCQSMNFVVPAADTHDTIPVIIGCAHPRPACVWAPRAINKTIKALIDATVSAVGITLGEHRRLLRRLGAGVSAAIAHPLIILRWAAGNEYK